MMSMRVIGSVMSFLSHWSLPQGQICTGVSFSDVGADGDASDSSSFAAWNKSMQVMDTTLFSHVLKAIRLLSHPWRYT